MNHASLSVRFTHAPNRDTSRTDALSFRLPTSIDSFMASSRNFTVSQLNGKIAVLIDGDGRSVAIPAARLPRDLKSGNVLSVPFDGAGTPIWASAEIDNEEPTKPAVRDVESSQNPEDAKQD